MIHSKMPKSASKLMSYNYYIIIDDIIKNNKLFCFSSELTDLETNNSNNYNTEHAKTRIAQLKKIINLNKMNFFNLWIQKHM